MENYLKNILMRLKAFQRNWLAPEVFSLCFLWYFVIFTLLMYIIMVIYFKFLIYPFTLHSFVLFVLLHYFYARKGECWGLETLP